MGHTEAILDPVQAIEVLRQLAADMRALSKASVYYRLLMGRHLITIQKNQLWRLMERRDYCKDPRGTRVWLSPTTRAYSSWYNFLEEGFENITGLHRQTAYSAIKLAHSSSLSALSIEELQNFKRLANALELVSRERTGLEITPELVIQAQAMPIKQFRRAARVSEHAVNPRQQVPALSDVIKFLKSAAAIDPQAIDGFWEIMQHALKRENQNPARAVESIVTAYAGLIRKPLSSEQIPATYRAKHRLRANNASAAQAS